MVNKYTYIDCMYRGGGNILVLFHLDYMQIETGHGFWYIDFSAFPIMHIDLLCSYMSLVFLVCYHMVLNFNIS